MNHNEADDIADKIEETLLSYNEPLDTASLPKPMFGEQNNFDDAPKFGTFDVGRDSEDDGMPLAS